VQAYVEKIAVPAYASFNYLRYKTQQHHFHYHYHPEFELTLVIKGSGKRFVGDSIASYQAGDLVLVGHQLPHTWASDTPGPHESIVVHFSRNIFDGKLSLLPECREIEQMLERASQGLGFNAPCSRRVAILLKALQHKKGMQRLLLFLNVLQTMAENGGSLLSNPGFSTVFDVDGRERIDRVVSHLYAHPSEDFSLPKAAQLASMSVSAFSRFFKRCTGKSWVVFVTDFRIGIACRLLLASSKSVSEICFESGFKNLSNFNRKFLRLRSMSPMAFRDEFLRKSGTKNLS
jgi:AraC-like DNA-binding protein/mannose-6-phosphate isomerase-like protein (cupin superfamily)